MNYARGNVVRLTGTFYDIDDALTDPDTVSFEMKASDGSTTTYVYLTDAQLVRDSTGVYYVDADTDTAGTYFYRFHSTGDGKAADWKRFEVKTDPFA